MSFHRYEIETHVIWIHPWARSLNFVRENFSLGEPMAPRGTLIVAYVRSGRSFRTYFLLPPYRGKLDGVGTPRHGFGRPCSPDGIHERHGVGGPSSRRIPRAASRELQRAFGVYRPHWLKRFLCWFIRPWWGAKTPT
jgi:hypothetical protein